MIRALIVEDEAPSAKKLAFLINSLADDIEIIGQTDSISSTVSFLSTHEVDLIFLDIHLGDGNSFKIFDQIEVDTPIIFTTAFDQYAIEAFKQNSLDYLLKPINKDELEASIEKFRKLHMKSEIGTTPVDYQALASMIAQNSKPSYKNRFMVHYRDKIKTIPANEVAYFFAESKAVFLCDMQGKIYDLNYTLDKLNEQLDPDIFFRVNRKCIINIKAIDEVYIYAKSKLKIEMNPKASFEILVPAEKVSKFKHWLNG